MAVPTPENARKWLRILTAEPHVVWQTPADYKTAVFVRDKLREWGWKAELAELEVYCSTILKPITKRLSKFGDLFTKFSTWTPPIAGDNDSARKRGLRCLQRLWRIGLCRLWTNDLRHMGGLKTTWPLTSWASMSRTRSCSHATGDSSAASKS